jgi:hypothetical protein
VTEQFYSSCKRKMLQNCSFINHLDRAQMYNGIGLATARGSGNHLTSSVMSIVHERIWLYHISGTNGYVVRNLSSLRPQRREPDRSFDDMKSRGPAIKQPNQEILLHDRKRQIEVECLKLRLILEDDEYVQKHFNSVPAWPYVLIPSFIRVNEDDIEVKVQALRDSLNAKLDTVQPKSAKRYTIH